VKLAVFLLTLFILGIITLCVGANLYDGQNNWVMESGVYMIEIAGLGFYLGVATDEIHI